MLIKDINSIPEFTAGDDTILRVILHPDNEPLPVGYSLAHARVKPANSSQYIENTGNEDLVFLCIVNPAWRREDETISRPF